MRGLNGVRMVVKQFFFEIARLFLVISRLHFFRKRFNRFP